MTILPLGGKRILTPALGRSWQRAAGGGWWLSGGISAANCIAAYQPKGAASYAASLTDLSGNGNDAYEGVQPNWNTATGWTGNMTDMYLLTGVTVNSDNSHTLIIRYSGYNDTSWNYDALMGIEGSVSGRYGMVQRNIRRYVVIGTTMSEMVRIAGTANTVCLAGKSYYFDGVYKGAHAGGTVSGEISIMKLQFSTVGYGYSNILAAAIYSAVLTSAQISALTTAMNAL